MKQGEIVRNFSVKMINSVEFDLYRTLSNGPVILNFIIGTWCPTCSNHLKKIIDWKKQIQKEDKITVLIISAESEASLKSWVSSNSYPYLFASDQELTLISEFEVKMPMMKSAKPVTILIDTDKTIKLMSGGIRTSGKRKSFIDSALNR